MTALMQCAKENKMAEAELLLLAGARIEAKDNQVGCQGSEGSRHALVLQSSCIASRTEQHLSCAEYDSTNVCN
jgi:hypothetical protein